MKHDDRVILMGQDIAEYGGVFKITEGFVDAFGKERVRNTPIIESGVLGAALGLALEDYRPVVEMQFGDFITCGFNQIVNNLAKTHYRWGEGARGDPRTHRWWRRRWPLSLTVSRGLVHTSSRTQSRGPSVSGGRSTPTSWCHR